MAITPGTDTWVTLEEAEALLSRRVGTSEWFALNDEAVSPGEESKETYLTTAYQWLSGMYGLGADASAPDDLKAAQSLFANWLISNRKDYEARESLSAAGVQEFDWSRWGEKIGEVGIPRFVSDLILNLGIGSANAAVQLYGEDYQE